jgi:hypothetical protein
MSTIMGARALAGMTRQGRQHTGEATVLVVDDHRRVLEPLLTRGDVVSSHDGRACPD